ncbi:hypothetical protein V5O48_011830 [Marasmius crinis-equi]|uniref:F-box domain-containing protein n=1 Tax=Marasmius crinis-equi TaxID=585013 RepID=A0ABR3F4P8_9AGAR
MDSAAEVRDVTTCQPPRSVNTLHDYDEKIKKLNEELKQVQYERNLLVSICRLPSEILGSIFTFYANFYSYTHTHSGLHWLNVLLVCRLWKNTAYNTPTMWATPDFMFPKLARNMLKRSKSIPLKIRWSFAPPLEHDQQRESFLEAINQTSRVASLELFAYAPDVGFLFEEALAKMKDPAPFLSSIVIDCTQGSNMISLPVDFLAGDAPRLTRLDLAGCTISWQSSMLKNLTYLSVRHQPIELRPPCENVFEALQEIPSLEVLALEHCVSSARFTLPPDVTLAFPHLKRLFLALDVQPSLAFLQRMSFPDTTAIHLRLDALVSCPDEHFDRLFVYISDLLAPAATVPSHPRVIKGLMLQSLDDHYESLNISALAWNTDKIAIDPEAETGEVTPHLQLEFETAEDRMIEDMRRLLEVGPLCHLEALRIDTLIPLPSDTIIQCLGNLTRLNSMYLEDKVPYEFIRLLSRNLTPAPASTKRKTKRGRAGKNSARAAAAAKRAEEAQAKGSSQSESLPPLFPALKTLNLTNVDFRRESTHLLSPLIKGLKLRSENGCPLDKVVLADCTRLYAGDVRKIEKQVDVVDWDGMVYSGDEDEFDDDEGDPYFPPFIPFGFFGGYGPLGGFMGPNI